MRLTVRMKMIGGFGIILASLLIIAGFAYWNLTEIQAVLRQMTGVVTPTVQIGDELMMTLWEASTLAQEYLLEEDAAKLDEFAGRFDALTVRYAEANRQLRTMTSDNTGLQEDLQGADAEFQDFVTHSTAMFAAHRVALDKQAQVNTLTQQFEDMADGLRNALEELAFTSEQAFQESQAMTDFQTIETTLRLRMMATEALDIAREYLATENPLRLAGVRKNFERVTSLTTMVLTSRLQKSAATAQEKTDAALLEELVAKFTQITLDEGELFDLYQQYIETKTLADTRAGTLELDTNSMVETLAGLVEASEQGDDLMTIVWEANTVAKAFLAETEQADQFDERAQQFETLVKAYQAASLDLRQELGDDPAVLARLDRADEEFAALSGLAREIFADHRAVVEQALNISARMQQFEAVAEELKSGLAKMAALREQEFKMAQEMSVTNYNAVEATLKLSKLVGDALETVREYLSLNNPETLPGLREEFSAIVEKTNEYEQQLLQASVSEAEQADAEQLVNLITEFEESLDDEDELFAEYERHLEAGAQAAALRDALEADVAAAVVFLDHVVETVDALTVVADQQADEKIRQAGLIMAVLTLIAVAVSLSISIFTISGIVNALRASVQLAESIANGDLATRITVKRRDELGDLARSLKDMQLKIGRVVQEMQMLIQAIQEGRLSTRGDAALFPGGWRDLVAGVNDVVDAFMRPFYVVSGSLDRMAKGEMPERITAEYQGDFVQIKHNLNHLIQSLSDIMGEITSGTDVLLDSVQHLSSSSQEISTTSNQQAAAVKEIVSTMEDSEQLTQSITAKIEQVTDMTSTTKTSVENGFVVLQNSLAQMDAIRATNAETITEMRALGEKIASIWEIVNMINDIADQTKIIAFNAELEASSAGEAGKNFQIVASEIRRLADSTVASTSEIKAKIHEIQRSSDQLIMTSEEGTVKIQDGWELSKNLQRLFENVRQSADVSAGATDQIALSIKQQASAFAQILQTLKQISEGVENFVTSTKATTQASQQLQEIADGLHAVLERFTSAPDSEAGQELEDHVDASEPR